MTHGLLTQRQDGTSIITPETFTVRYVDGFYVGGGEASSVVRIQRPSIKSGMFATCSPAAEYPMSIPPEETAYSNFYGLCQYQLDNAVHMPPALECGDGYIDLSPPIYGGIFSRGIYIQVYSYL